MTNVQIQEALEENANDYITRSIEAYNNNDGKAAIMYLWSGILLLLKIWIFRIQPAMIYSKWENVISFSSGKLEFANFVADGNFQTVDYNEIKERFEFLGNKASILFKYDHALNEMRKKRNRMEHFLDDISENELISIFVKLLPFINDFIEDELNENVNEFLPCWDDYLEINEVYQHRLKKMEEFIDSQRPSCRDIKHGTAELIEVDCPNCSNGKLIETDENTLYCKACEYTTKYLQCERCSEIILEDDFDSFLEETGMCSDCLDELCESSD